MEDSLAIALDLGTTSIKGAVLGARGHLEPVYVEPAPIVVQTGNRFESDAFEYLAVCSDMLSRCLEASQGTPPLGLSNQRSSFVIWQKSSGRPVTPLISWQDSRAELMCRSLTIDRHYLRESTGLWLTPYFFAPKVAHVLAEQPDWNAGLEQGELLIGTLDSFLIWHWTEGKAYRTDLSMAARTLLVDLAPQYWSTDLARCFGISVDYLPAIGPSQDIGLPLIQGICLQASVADQSAAVLAATPGRGGEVLVNLGTGGFVCCFIDENFDMEKLGGYQKTLVYQDAELKSYFAVEGTINSIGRALKTFTCQNLSISKQKVLKDYYCVPEPSGLGAPFFREDIKLCFSQSVENLSSEQISGLIIEGVIFRVKQILDDLYDICGIKRVFLAGGWSRLPALQQGIAQCSPVDVHLLQETECSLLGAALLALGKPDMSRTGAVHLKKTEEVEFLNSKYIGWRNWLDQLLALECA